MIKFRNCPFAISSAQLPASHDRHLYLSRSLRSLGLYVAAFGTSLIVACGQREEPVPEVRGQTMTKQEAADLSFELSNKTFSLPGARDFEKELNVEVLLPRLHKWFRSGWGLRPQKFTNGQLIYRVMPLPDYVVEDLAKVLIPNYMTHVPLILTARFWKDMKKLTEYPDKEVVLSFQSLTTNSKVIHTAGNTIFLTFSLNATLMELVHEGTHLRAFLSSDRLPPWPNKGVSDLSEVCFRSLEKQIDEIDASYRESAQADSLMDGLAYWYSRWSDKQLKTFIWERAIDLKKNLYQDHFGGSGASNPIFAIAMNKLDKSCPQGLLLRNSETAEHYFKSSSSARTEGIVFRANNFFKTIAEDINSHELGEESCLSESRKLAPITIEDLLALPFCKKKFGPLHEAAKRAPVVFEREFLKPLLERYFQDLSDYHTLLSDLVISYQRLLSIQKRDQEKQILEFFPKGLFHENN